MKSCQKSTRYHPVRPQGIKVKEFALRKQLSGTQLKKGCLGNSISRNRGLGCQSSAIQELRSLGSHEAKGPDSYWRQQQSWVSPFVSVQNPRLIGLEAPTKISEKAGRPGSVLQEGRV